MTESAAAPDAAEVSADRAGGVHGDELWRLARASVTGDPDAAATLVLHVAGPILAVVRRVLGRAHPDVDDVAQDAVIALLRALESFRGECSVVHFAHRIALITALGARRRMRRHARWSALAADPDGEVEARGVRAAPAAESRRRAVVRELLDELPEPTAEALALHFILGYTVDEIAAAAAVSPNTVWSRLRLGKSALRRRIELDATLAELLEEGA